MVLRLWPNEPESLKPHVQRADPFTVHNISGSEILTDLDERTMPIATGEGVAKALIIGEATISTNYKKDTLFPTPT